MRLPAVLLVSAFALSSASAPAVPAGARPAWPDGASSADEPGPAAPEDGLAEARDALLESVNAARAERHLAPLALHPALSAIAQSRAIAGAAAAASGDPRGRPLPEMAYRSRPYRARASISDGSRTINTCADPRSTATVRRLAARETKPSLRESRSGSGPLRSTRTAIAVSALAVSVAA